MNISQEQLREIALRVAKEASIQSAMLTSGFERHFLEAGFEMGAGEKNHAVLLTGLLFTEFEKHPNSLVADAEAQAESAMRIWPTYRKKEVERLTAQRDRLSEKVTELLKAEHRLSAAYIRLRSILGALDTVPGPTAQEVWAHTEAKATDLVTRVSELENDSIVEFEKKAMLLDKLRALEEQAPVACEYAHDNRDGTWTPTHAKYPLPSYIIPHSDRATRLLYAAPVMPTVPEGYALAPIDPTDNMCAAAIGARLAHPQQLNGIHQYRAMIAAHLKNS